jgi:hypothetical protein
MTIFHLVSQFHIVVVVKLRIGRLSDFRGLISQTLLGLSQGWPTPLFKVPPEPFLAENNELYFHIFQTANG